MVTTSPSAYEVNVALKLIVSDMVSGEIKRLSVPWMQDVLSVALENRQFVLNRNVRSILHHQKGRLLVGVGQYSNAVDQFNLTLKYAGEVETGFMQAAILATHHQYCDALKQLHGAERLFKVDPKFKQKGAYYESELTRLRSLIQTSLDERKQSCTEFSAK